MHSYILLKTVYLLMMKQMMKPRISEEYERISKELYGDVNVKLTDAEHNDEEKGDADMTNDAHVQVEQTQEQTKGIQEESGPEIASIQGQYVVQATTTTNPAIQNATTEVPSLSSSHSVASTYTNAFLNLENLQSTKTEVVSMLDINVQHEVPRTSPVLTIHVSIIHEHTIFHPSKIVTTAPATTISSLFSSLFPSLQQSIPIPTPTNTKAITSTIAVLESQKPSLLSIKELLIWRRILDDALYKKSIEDIQKIKMEHARKQEVPKETITSSDTIALEEFDQKTTLFNTMTKSKSFNKSPKHRALYNDLIESILEDEDAMDKGVVDELKKRKPDDADKDEGP
ncbi:hypothetical protein Tco_1265290 [Tanacetum coccineum]